MTADSFKLFGIRWWIKLAGKHFEFADFVQEFKVNFTVLGQDEGYYAPNGEWVPGVEISKPCEGIILPLSDDDLKYDLNGLYTLHDRKIYTTTPLKIGQQIEHQGRRYTIQNEKAYSDYADVYIYYAKGASE
jgi:hypothetical protein